MYGISLSLPRRDSKREQMIFSLELGSKRYLRDGRKEGGGVKVEHGGSFWRLYKLSTYRSNTSQTVCATWSHTGARRQPRLPDIPEGRIPDLQTSRQCLPFQRIDLLPLTDDSRLARWYSATVSYTFLLSSRSKCFLINPKHPPFEYFEY